ncbi:class I SAM-dependent methyltransferase [Microbacterium sp. HD4P20]|uniref:class I SAM-dependent methyltransferase n=1 Tax=Microbacterium sp. HD4P20 TaxID=2864874 RepID=UPI001C641F3D|nr:class I SAM-dependent methyltransferase [Microbacterium sp. HD4P20]MCP2637628.1 class I SAM-dependent methyltransferase [Microbacterium sp. HD4P20]
MTHVTAGAPGIPPTSRFGTGPGEPYDQALRGGASHVTLRDVRSGAETSLDLGRFLKEPSRLERHLVGELPGPILDIGCGPGRMLHAARLAGHRALGVDVSHASIGIATARGHDAVHGSVFESLPREGAWGSALLLDGNIGIGGDPVALLARCAQLVRVGGRIAVETHPRTNRDRRFDGVLVDADGRASLPFRWAEVGAAAARRHAAAVGLYEVRTWHGRRRQIIEFGVA